MTFLANIPIWLYFVILAITFMVVHVMALRANQPKNRARSLGGRVLSSLLLLLALVFLNPADPGSLLLSLFGAAVAGFVSGRTATPPLPPRQEQPAEPQDTATSEVAPSEPGGEEPRERT